ncbi:hypothetical protein [Paraburkholderia terrae]
MTGLASLNPGQNQYKQLFASRAALADRMRTRTRKGLRVKGLHCAERLFMRLCVIIEQKNPPQIIVALVRLESTSPTVFDS